MFDKSIIVNGVRCKINSYTEKRLKILAEIEKEQQEFISDNSGIRFGGIPKDKRAEWYRRKAEVFWTPEVPLTEKFFQSEDFEVSRLKETEDFFLSFVSYL